MKTYDFWFSLMFHKRRELNQTQFMCGNCSSIPRWITRWLNFRGNRCRWRFQACWSAIWISLGKRLDATKKNNNKHENFMTSAYIWLEHKYITYSCDVPGCNPGCQNCKKLRRKKLLIINIDLSKGQKQATDGGEQATRCEHIQEVACVGSICVLTGGGGAPGG